MAVFKCKMCGGQLDITENMSTATCEYCGSQQTLPKLNDDKVENLFNRANHFRRNNEFDKAMGIYEQILDENTSDSEVYWSLVLCRYGIEYVEDPVTHRRVPTVNRTQLTSIFDDENYKSALQYADASQKAIYEEEAHQINEIQKGILAISQNEDPFDVFICYKETDENGQRTRDSVQANELYHELTKEGFKVFYARITLEDKLGQAYEPYIFAALNSAKVMVVIGSNPDYFNAVWVKNEWSRYLGMMKKGEKKTLIPAYSGMDPYDLPDEFAHLQAQDMSKLGFMPDLIRGIKKIIGVEEPKNVSPVASTVVEGGSTAQVGIQQLLKRIEIFLYNDDWQDANSYCEKVLDIEPENGQAYVYKLLGQAKVSSLSELVNSKTALDEYPVFKNVLKFAEPATLEQIKKTNEQIKQRLAEEERRRIEKIKHQSELDAVNTERNNALTTLENLKEKATEIEHEIRTFNKKDRFDGLIGEFISSIGYILSGIIVLIMLAVIAADPYDETTKKVFSLFALIYFLALPAWMAFLRCNSTRFAMLVNVFTLGFWYLVISIITIIKFFRQLGVINNQYDMLVQNYNKVYGDIGVVQNYVDELSQKISDMS